MVGFIKDEKVYYGRRLNDKQIDSVMELQERIEEKYANDYRIFINDSIMSEAIYIEIEHHEDEFYKISIRNHYNEDSDYDEAIWLADVEFDEIEAMLENKIKKILGDE